MADNQALQLVELILSKLGMASSQAIPAYARYLYYDAWAYLVLGVALLTVFTLAGIWVFLFDKRKEACDPNYRRSEDALPSECVGVLIILCGVLICSLLICNQVAYIRAPEGFAVRQLIQDVRGNR